MARVAPGDSGEAALARIFGEDLLSNGVPHLRHQLLQCAAGWLNIRAALRGMVPPAASSDGRPALWRCDELNEDDTSVD